MFYVYFDVSNMVLTLFCVYILLSKHQIHNRLQIPYQWCDEPTTVSTETNAGGVYQYELSSCDIAPSATLVEVEYEDSPLRGIEVDNIDDRSCDDMDGEGSDESVILTLQHLSLGQNQITGPIPPSLLQEMDTMDDSAASSFFAVGGSIIAASVVSIVAFL